MEGGPGGLHGPSGHLCMWTGSGLLTVDIERAHWNTTGEQLHVYFNGIDVTSRAFRADNELGYVMVFCKDQITHHPMQDTGVTHLSPHGLFACSHRLEGEVVIKPGPAFPSRIGL